MMASTKDSAEEDDKEKDNHHKCLNNNFHIIVFDPTCNNTSFHRRNIICTFRKPYGDVNCFSLVRVIKFRKHNL